MRRRFKFCRQLSTVESGVLSCAQHAGSGDAASGRSCLTLYSNHFQLTAPPFSVTKSQRILFLVQQVCGLVCGPETACFAYGPPQHASSPNQRNCGQNTPEPHVHCSYYASSKQHPRSSPSPSPSLPHCRPPPQILPFSKPQHLEQGGI